MQNNDDSFKAESRELIRTTEHDTDTFARLIGLEITEIGEGTCRAHMIIEEKHVNPFGTVHGGCLYTLADTTAGTAAASDLRYGPTLNGELYFAHTTAGAKELFCEARVVKNGKTIKLVDFVITDDLGRENARGTLQYYVTGKHTKEHPFFKEEK